MNNLKATDLRIGDLVNHVEYGILPICSLHSDNIVRLMKKGENIGCFRFSSIEPIPLTEEWLLKFEGVKKIQDRFYINDICIIWDEDTFRDSQYMFELKYLHQFQNFIYLTGEELKIKE